MPQMHCTASHCTAPYCTALNYTALYCTVLYCTVLYCTVLLCLQAPLVAVGPADPAVVVASLRRHMEALDALSSERAGVWGVMFLVGGSLFRRGMTGWVSIVCWKVVAINQGVACPTTDVTCSVVCMPTP
jgi:hypothetical protein